MDVGDLEPIEDYDTKEDEEKDMSEGKEAVHSEAGIKGGGLLNNKIFGECFFVTTCVRP